MIEDENHPRMLQAFQELCQHLDAYVDKPMNDATLQHMGALINDHRAKWRMRNVAFPPLVPIIIPRLGVIDLKRADLDKQSICVSIVNFVRANPAVRRDELVKAFRAAYPDLRPDDIQEYVERTQDADRVRQENLERVSKVGEV